MTTRFHQAKRRFLRKRGFPILLLAILALIAYGRSATVPSLLGDEWGSMGQYYTGTLACPSWGEARVFANCWYWFVYGLFGAQIEMHHLAAIAANLLAAILLLLLLEQIWPRLSLLTFMTAALFLVSPANLTHTWWLGNVWGINVLLAAGYFLARYWRQRHWWLLVIGLLLVGVTMGVYEAPIGLVILLSIGLFLTAREWSPVQRITLLTPAFVVGLYSIWRWLWQLSTGAAYGHSTESVSFSLSTLLERLIYGSRVNLQWSWTNALLRLLPPLSGSETSARILSLLTLVCIISFVMLIATFIIKRLSSSAYRPAGPLPRTEIDALGKVAAVGLFALVVGYFPYILLVFPGEDFMGSRANHLPSIGAAILISALLLVVAGILCKNRHRANIVALFGLLPLLLLGLVTQISVQEEIHLAWTDQKQVWERLFVQAPGIEEETSVILILEDCESSSSGLLPFVSGKWGFGSALNVLYGTNSLNGSFAYGSPNDLLSFEDQNIRLSLNGDQVFPLVETVVFRYECDSRILSHVQPTREQNGVESQGQNRILDTPTQDAEFRWLVR